jgi:hypothetical protein
MPSFVSVGRSAICDDGSAMQEMNHATAAGRDVTDLSGRHIDRTIGDDKPGFMLRSPGRARLGSTDRCRIPRTKAARQPSQHPRDGEMPAIRVSYQA